MLDFVKHLRIGPIHFYISSRRLKNPGRERIRQRAKHAIEAIKRQRYRQRGGCCEVCGQKYPRKRLEMHHIAPISERPDLVDKSTNLLMVCRACHMQLHKKAHDG